MRALRLTLTSPSDPHSLPPAALRGGFFVPEQSEGTVLAYVADALRHSSPTARESVWACERAWPAWRKKACRLMIRRGRRGDHYDSRRGLRLTIRRVTRLRLLQKIA